MRAGRRLLIKKEQFAEINGRRKKIASTEFFYADPGQDFHSKNGRVLKADLARPSGSRFSSGNHEYVILDCDFIDHYRRIKRSAQIIGLKDIGPIITKAGLTRSSKVLEAGVGSGAVTCFLANLVKKIVSYDVDERSLETARENVKSFGFKNVTIKKGDIYEAKNVSEKGFDAFVLDAPEPWKALGTARKALRVGGFLAVYVPHVMQVQNFVNALGDDFLLDSVIEVIEREWAIDENRTRPTTKDHAHTGFLAFARRIS